MILIIPLLRVPGKVLVPRSSDMLLIFYCSSKRFYFGEKADASEESISYMFVFGT